ncbi:sulfite exporter TauE/SafE family protein [Thalassotalea piscium]
MIISTLVFCMILGCVAGFLAGLLGIGGGLVIVPALIYLLSSVGVQTELVMPISLATSLASIMFISSSAAWAHHKNGNIPWTITKKLMVTVALGALLGVYIASILSSNTLTIIFAIAVITLATYMLLSIRMVKVKPMPKTKVIEGIGLFTGAIASLMGISGGAILVPVLTYFSMSIRHAIGTATICGFVVATFGVIGFMITGFNQDNLPQWSIGYVYLPALLGVVATSSLFARLGVKWAATLPVKTLKKMFAAFLIIVAIKMIFK